MKIITIENTIKAPITIVWNCWTMPEHIIKWNYASEDWHTTRSENDLQIGGKFLSRMEAKDGSFGFDFFGFYDEIIFQKSIKYTMGDNRKASLTFEETTSGIRIIEQFEPETENTIDLQQFGWQAILNNFKTYVENHINN
jgi:uncharacterized protein YndB with AHSA1/START domain